METLNQLITHPLFLYFVAMVFWHEALHAVKDTLHHHHPNSVFRGFGKTSFWGQADHVWLRKYEGFDPSKKRKWWAGKLDGIMDAWHLSASIQYAQLVGMYVIMRWWYEGDFWLRSAEGFAVWIFGNIVFNFGYKYVLKRK